MNNLPEDLIRKIYSYVQEPRMKFVNKYFSGILTEQEATYKLVIRADFSKYDFIWYKNLTRLHCYSNELTSLPNCLGNLTELYCSFNQLTSLPDCLGNLTVLDCSNNRLTSLPDCLGNLTVLDCRFNLLASLPNCLGKLTLLYCRGNRLTNLPDCLGKLSKLAYGVYIKKGNIRK